MPNAKAVSARPPAKVISIFRKRQLSPDQRAGIYRIRSRQIINQQRTAIVPHPNFAGSPLPDWDAEMIALNAAMLQLDREEVGLSTSEQSILDKKRKLKHLLGSATPIASTPSNIEIRIADIESQLAKVLKGLKSQGVNQ
jgi:hypothetical protein